MKDTQFRFSKRLIHILATANRVAVLTGAGISAESGVPTFRGEAGLWKKFKPAELANVAAFMKNPELVWEWYLYRRKIINEVQPNSAHFILAKMEGRYQDFTLTTQNVDGLHQRAGNKRIFELHGNILRNKCISCNLPYDIVDFEKGKPIPRCDCGGYIRPDVVWFGENLPQEAFSQSSEAARRAEVYFSIGTSAVVYPAAQLPLEAIQAGAYVVEINPEPTPISNVVSELIVGKAGHVLPQLWKLVLQEKQN